MMTNHFLNPPFSMSQRDANRALGGAIDQFLENARKEGIEATSDDARRLLTSGSDWWESVENTRAWVAARRMRPKYVTLEPPSLEAPEA